MTADLPQTEEHILPPGTDRVLPSQDLRLAVEKGWMRAENWAIRPESIQPASIDLRLGKYAWPLRSSFLPDAGSTVEQKHEEIRGSDLFDRIDIREGGVLEQDRPYLIPLIESLNLPAEIRGKANPKSSTGRLDVFTRLLTDRNNRFDEVTPGYAGPLFLEVVPRSFAIRVKEGLALNQLRLIQGDPHLVDRDIHDLHARQPLVYSEDGPAQAVHVSHGLFLSLDLMADPQPDRVVGYRAKKNSHPIDLESRGNATRQYWDPVYPEDGNRIVLEPEIFYLLLSEEAVCIPPEYAAEMMAYDPTAGEIRTHYAGFFDPGFGWDPKGKKHGSRAALEVRARDVPFMIEHGQPVCKLAFERTLEAPDVLYGSDLGSNYQGQETMLSKHFGDQKAGEKQMRIAPPLLRRAG